MKSRLAKLVLLLALSALPAFGQCAMCYSSAKGASNGGQAAITKGVLALLLPPISMMVGLVGFAFRYKRKNDSVGSDQPAAHESQNH
jgi:hypothetical protein